MKKNLFLKFTNGEIRKFPYEKLTFFKSNLKSFFSLDSMYIRDTPYRVLFDLDKSLTGWKKPIFEIH